MSEQPTRQVEAVDAEAVPNAAGDGPTGASQLSSVGRAAGRGLKWSLIGNIVTKLGGFIIALVLARLLSPAEFGTYAIALGAMYFLMHVNDVGIIAAAVQWRGRFEDMAPTATVLAFVYSVAIYLGCWFLAPVYAEFSGNPNAAGIVRLLTTVIVIDGVTAVRAAFLLRTFQQSLIIKANFWGFAVQAMVSIGLAAAGAGAYALAGGQAVGNLVIGVLVLLAAKVPPKFAFDREVAGKLVRYGLPLAGSLGVEAIVLNADYVVVGRTLGPTLLGLYLIAFNIASWAPTVIGTAVRYVSVSSFSRLAEGGEHLSVAVQNAITILVSVALPIAVCLSVLALPLIGVLYGPVWVGAAVALQFLALMSVVRLITLLVVDVLASVGSPFLTLWLNAGWCVVLIPALVLGTSWDGIRGTGIAHVAVAFGVALPLALYLLHRVGVRVSPIGRRLARPVAAAVAAALACALVSQLIGPGLAFLQLIVGGLTAVALYGAIAFPRELVSWCRSARSILPAPSSYRRRADEASATAHLVVSICLPVRNGESYLEHA